MESKQCTKCKSLLPLDEFNKKAKSKDGLNPSCRECEKAKKRKYYHENSQMIRDKANEYRLNNPEIIKERKKRYYEENKEKISVTNRIYREDNPNKVKEVKHKEYLKHRERYLERSKKWGVEHPELVKQFKIKSRQTPKGKAREKIIIERRRTRKNNLPATLTKSQWDNAKKFFDDKCCYCGSDKKLTLDHFIPLSKDGGMTLNNSLPACQGCNSSKGNRMFSSWYPRQSFYSKERALKILKYLNYDPKTHIQQLTLTV